MSCGIEIYNNELGNPIGFNECNNKLPYIFKTLKLAIEHIGGHEHSNVLRGLVYGRVLIFPSIYLAQGGVNGRPDCYL